MLFILGSKKAFGQFVTLSHLFTVMTCEIGFLTLPIGINLFVAARIANLSVEEISIGDLPLHIPYVLMIALLAFFSSWVTYLPDLVYGPRAY